MIDVLAMQAGPDMDRLVAERVMGWNSVALAPCFSGSALDAQPVAERMVAEGWRLTVQYRGAGSAELGQWSVGFDRGDCHAAAFGATWPEALCKAALAAMEEARAS